MENVKFNDFLNFILNEVVTYTGKASDNVLYYVIIKATNQTFLSLALSFNTVNASNYYDQYGLISNWQKINNE